MNEQPQQDQPTTRPAESAQFQYGVQAQGKPRQKETLGLVSAIGSLVALAVSAVTVFVFGYLFGAVIIVGALLGAIGINLGRTIRSTRLIVMGVIGTVLNLVLYIIFTLLR